MLEEVQGGDSVLHVAALAAGGGGAQQGALRPRPVPAGVQHGLVQRLQGLPQLKAAACTCEARHDTKGIVKSVKIWEAQV